MVNKEDIRIKQIETNSQRYLTEINRLEVQNSLLKSEVIRLKLELNKAKSLKQQAKNLYDTANARILDEFELRGRRRRAHRVKAKYQIPPDIIKNGTVVQLLDEAQKYDVSTYFRLHSPKSSMKLYYRVMARTYKVSRDSAKFTAKVVFRLAKRPAKVRS